MSSILGVCGWVLDRADPARSLELAKQVGASCVQLGFFSESAIAKADPHRLKNLATENGVSLVGSFVAFEGEDYSSIDAIARTGGLTPDERYSERKKAIARVATITNAIGCSSLAIHVGTISADDTDPTYRKLIDRTREVADQLTSLGIRLLIETGRESAETLAQFVDAIGRQNIGISFDVGNFVIYGTDDPARAIRPLRQHIEVVHIKDATRSPAPGLDYGSPAILGTGDVQVARVVNRLRTTGFAGPMLVETKGIDPAREGLVYLGTLLK